jgi:hypothetical protein
VTSTTLTFPTSSSARDTLLPDCYTGSAIGAERPEHSPSSRMNSSSEAISSLSAREGMVFP